MRAAQVSGELTADLRVAHERLCRAQVKLGADAAHRDDLQTAITVIERVGVFCCPDWSSHRLPTTEWDK